LAPADPFLFQKVKRRKRRAFRRHPTRCDWEVPCRTCSALSRTCINDLSVVWSWGAIILKVCNKNF
jgi:hypothetical protein